MIDAPIAERLRAFLDHADTSLDRGNTEGVREALDDARALVEACALDAEVEW
jgi:hypothetical protein